MAGETGTPTPGKESEFPVFKSEGGAFDRAKFNSTIRTGAGQTISPETFEAMKAADSASEAAKIFYEDSFDKNIKELDPGLDPKSIFYREAYDERGTDRMDIRERIDKGEAIDGKEIFEMSKSSASNKVENAKVLKTGKATEIIENIGYRDIKDFEAFDDVRDEFNEKVKDENLKFDVLASKFLNILSYFNDERPMDTKTISTLYSPENNAIISALSKILEAEGFNSESVLNMSKRYDDNLAKLLEKSKSGSVESIKTVSEEKKIETPPTATSEEQKVSEKKEGATEAPVPTPIEPAKTEAPEAVESTESKGTTATETKQETTLTTKTEEEPKKVEGSTEAPATNTANTTTSNTTAGQPASTEASSRIDSMISNLLGIKSGGAGATGAVQSLENKVTGTSQEVSAAIDKNIESLGFKSKSGGASTAKSTVENLSTKNETSSASTGIKETETQKLGSVVTPVENKPTEENKATTPSPVNSETETNKVSAETASLNSTQGTEQNKGETPKETVSSKDNDDLSKTMETMVTLLTQLNNTMQGPLLVTSMSKKID